MIGLGMTILIISNKGVDDITEIVKSNSEKNRNEAKEQNAGFLIMLLGFLGARLLANLSTRKGVKAKIPGPGLIRAVK